MAEYESHMRVKLFVKKKEKFKKLIIPNEYVEGFIEILLNGMPISFDVEDNVKRFLSIWIEDNRK
jgi:hypothetical protein